MKKVFVPYFISPHPAKVEVCFTLKNNTGTFSLNNNEYRDVSFLDRTLSEGVMQQGATQTDFALCRQNQDISIWYQGRTYHLHFDLMAGYDVQVDSGLPQENILKAELPCRILKISVAENDTVIPHQSLLTIESMKMEMTLSASATALIKKIYVQPNDVVQAGDLLIELEYTEG